MNSRRPAPDSAAPAGAEPILRTVNLTKSYFLGETIYAVNDVSLAIEPKEFVVIVGPSGCGKTTLLSLLGGLDRPNSGEVLLRGQRYSRLSENGLAQLRRNHIGFVFQFFNWSPVRPKSPAGRRCTRTGGSRAGPAGSTTRASPRSEEPAGQWTLTGAYSFWRATVKACCRSGTSASTSPVAAWIAYIWSSPGTCAWIASGRSAVLTART